MHFPVRNLEHFTDICLILCVAVAPKAVCQPSPCGPNSQCREVNGHAVCSCISGFIGTPPSCRPECVSSAECPLQQACLNQKCRDPCPGTCGQNARCQVVNHNPICSCSQGNTGDPFTRCYPVPGRSQMSFFSYFISLLIIYQKSCFFVFQFSIISVLA
jgi:hypothetical protein